MSNTQYFKTCAFMEPLQPYQVELEKFVAEGTEVNKQDLLKQVKDKVSFYLFSVLRNLSFHSIGKDEKGQLYIL